MNVGTVTDWMWVAWVAEVAEVEVDLKMEELATRTS